MNRTIKIVVTGPFGAGKTRFIKSISEIDVVSTERKITRREKGVKRETTVAMDYGRVTFDDDVLHLYGRQLGRELDGAYQDEWRDFAGAARDGQDHPGQDARHGAW